MEIIETAVPSITAISLAIASAKNVINFETINVIHVSNSASRANQGI